MTRDRQRPESLGVFSDWHRNHMPSWYTYIDIDYTGYIDPKRWPEYGYEIYLFVELIHIRNSKDWGPDIPTRYPIHEHKRQVYRTLEMDTGTPVLIIWHNHECTEFVVQRLRGGSITKKYYDNWNDVANVFDHMRERKLKELKRNSDAQTIG